MDEISDTARDGVLTRRDGIGYGGTIGDGGILAGCAGVGESESTAATNETDATTSSSSAADASHSVTVEPVGTVEFDDEELFDRQRVADIVTGEFDDA